MWARVMIEVEPGEAADAKVFAIEAELGPAVSGVDLRTALRTLDEVGPRLLSDEDYRREYLAGWGPDGVVLSSAIREQQYAARRSNGRQEGRDG